MDRIKSIGYVIIFLFLTINLPAQQISFNGILVGVNKPETESFQQELKQNRFIMISPYKNWRNPEIWAYNYNSSNDRADLWVHYYFDRSVFEKKRKRTMDVSITIMTFGSDNPVNASLKEQIIENCRSGGNVYDETRGYYYVEYVHDSGASFKIYSADDTNYIEVHNTIKISGTKQD
jgi:hypothetical protein